MSIEAVTRLTERLVIADSQPLLSEHLCKMASSESLRSPHFTLARRNERTGKQVPQAVAHRGYKAAYPENTMAAFRGAVEVGAQGLETDIHLSKDGVVVLSHDADLKRCFGSSEKILDCDWEYLSTFKTIQEPHERMPRLRDLLEYLASPGVEDIWLMLDIKLDNDSDTIMNLIAETIQSVPPSRPWQDRIVLGCWAAKYLPLCNRYLPNFSISHIGFSTIYARQFLKIPHVSFNMLQKAMIGPLGAKFLADCKRQKRAVFLWTVNEDKWMKWALRKGVDGVLTDDPKRYLEIVKAWEIQGEDVVKKEDQITWREVAGLLRLNMIVLVFGTLLRLKMRFFGTRKIGVGRKAPAASTVEKKAA